MTLIKDLMEIPETIHRGDFVLRLAEGVTHPDVVLGSYVVTPELKLCFEDALSFVRSAIDSRTSKASYLHGSFGSGKSHFMAVLHLILQGNPGARSIPELASVIQKHNDWIAGKKFLLAPYHMIGAHDMESGILGGYVDFVRRTHPLAPIPGVYLAEGMFRDAQTLRQRMGDESFFSAMNEGRSRTFTGGGWGDLDAQWDAPRFEAAIEMDPGDEERSQLIGTLIRSFFGSYDTQAGGRGEAFISLDKGLSVISKHAASLGYNALILFLDELILWLASHAADLRFVHNEGQKLAKLVEAQTPDRPAPVISFVARQRDLRELVGDAVPGAERLNFADALGHWEGRFHKITLEDRNLPAIAEKRVLKPRNDSARKELDAAFELTSHPSRIRESVMNVLLTNEGDRQMFRRVYPFSPALVQTLIAVSSVLQRERTALKVMVQLLVEQRDTLRVGDIVPAGDLFDAIAHGDEAFSQDMAIHFDNAKRLYHQKLLPVLEKAHGIRLEDIERLAVDDPKRIAFRNDDRLIKTLLLAALVPQVESLRSLNAERLAALNHGTIKTPIEGREGQEVLRRCRAWAASVGEVRIGEENNPTISIQLSGVDTEGIIEQARREDNQGNRSRCVRQMLFTQLGIEGEGEFEQHKEFLWRNTKRRCVVLFRNIRELPDSSLDNPDESWKLIIDFPFDEQGHGPRDDINQIQTFEQSHPQGTKTLCWIPAFLSVDAQKDLGMLVILEHVLAGSRDGFMGERFVQYSSHLSAQDRQSAKSLLENQRSVLRQRVQSHLDAAYGLDALLPGSLDSSLDLELNERFVSLWPGFQPQPPVAPNLGQAMMHLLDQALRHEFPAAPMFEAEIKSSHLKKVFEHVHQATQIPDGRLPIDKTVRPLLRQIANPLLLGEMGLDATHFVLGQHWKSHFARKAAETGTTISVSQLKKWIDEPRPMGLPKEVQNALILVYAAQTNRTFYLHGVPCDVSLSNVPDLCEVREQKLPDSALWEQAVQRAGAVFGVAVSRLLNATNLNALTGEVKKQASERRSSCMTYSQRVRDRMNRLGLKPEGTDRSKTVVATLTLVNRINDAAEGEIVKVLATAEVATSEAAMGECVSKSAELAGNLDGADWDILDAVGMLPDERRSAGEAILIELREALAADEHVSPLAPSLKSAQSKAVRLLTKATVTPAPPPPIDAVPPVRPGKRVVTQGTKQNLAGAEAAELISRLNKELLSGQKLRIHVSWTIEEDGSES